jgi:hypothetical protein
MAVQRFVLDSTTLDNAGFGLDGGAAFILDTSTLDSTRVLDGGEFLTVATGSSSLGGLSASASAVVTVSAVGSASLGGVSASATATVLIFPVWAASLGGVSASASAQSTIVPVLAAPLDGQVASAIAQSAPPEPPVIPPSGSRWWRQPATPVKKQEPPEQIIIEIPKPKMPLVVSAMAGSRLGGFDVGALGSVTFSILDDDAEVLLLV